MYDHCGQSHQKKNKVKRTKIKYRASTFYHIWRGGHIPPVELNQSWRISGRDRLILNRGSPRTFLGPCIAKEPTLIQRAALRFASLCLLNKLGAFSVQSKNTFPALKRKVSYRLVQHGTELRFGMLFIIVQNLEIFWRGFFSSHLRLPAFNAVKIDVFVFCGLK